MITLKKQEKWKVNESLRKVKSKMVDRAFLCGASRGGVCVLGVRSVRESRRRHAIASGEGELEREVEQQRGVKGRDPDTCSYLNLQLLAEVTVEGLRREALYCSGL